MTVIVPLFWGFVLLAVAGATVLHVLGVPADTSAEFWFSILIGPVAVSAIVAVIWSLRRGFRWLSTWKRCPHGIIGGVVRSKCPVCVEQRKREEEKKREEQEERTRKARISADSEKLCQEESERLYREQLADLRRLRDMDPLEFELVVCRMFEKLGYRVEHTPFTNDGGKDALMWRNGTKCVLECKRYREGNHVGRPELQKFFAAMKEERASWGVFVTTSSFTDTAKEYSKKSGLELVSGEGLAQLMEQVYPGTPTNCVRAMCPDCGEVVAFSASGDETIVLCSCGHVVPRPIVRPRPPHDAIERPHHPRRHQRRYAFHRQ